MHQPPKTGARHPGRTPLEIFRSCRTGRSDQSLRSRHRGYCKGRARALDGLYFSDLRRVPRRAVPRDGGRAVAPSRRCRSQCAGQCRNSLIEIPLKGRCGTTTPRAIDRKRHLVRAVTILLIYVAFRACCRSRFGILPARLTSVRLTVLQTCLSVCRDRQLASR
jgi:hypothetical protein